MSRLLIAIFGRNSPAKLVAQRKTFLMVSIARPFPSRLFGRAKHDGIGPWRWSWPFVRVAGREWYFPALIDVWRKGDRASELGYDSFRWKLDASDRVETSAQA